MSPTKLLSRFVLMLLLIHMASCIKSEDFDFNKLAQLEWNPKMAVPLVSSELSMMDMIKQTGDSSNFEIDNQGFVTLVYKDRLFTIKPMADFVIPPSSFSISHTFTALEAAAIGSGTPFSIPFQQDIKLTPADSIRIDSLIYGKGDLTLTISGNVTNNGSIALSIPDAKKNGVALNATFTPLANGVKTIDLSGYKFDLTKVAGKPSTFRLSATITITNSPAGSITTGKTINFNFAQNTESIKVISGYLGRFYLIKDQKAVNINLFNNAFKIGTFNLENPYFIFTFRNSIGLPVNLKFTDLSGKSSEDGTIVNLVPNAGIPNPINVISPLYGDPDPVKVSTLRIDNVGTGGKISDLLNALKPGFLIYNLYSLTNPNGDVSENFLRDSSKLEVDVEFGLPLSGYVKDFAIQDTFDFKFDNIEDIESLMIRTIIDNEFPLEAKMQVYFTDANFVKLDSLVTTPTPADQIIIRAAQVNLTTGQLLSSTKKITDFNLPKTRINKIVGAEKILVKALLNTSGSATQNIKIYDFYKMSVKIAAQAEIKQKI